MGRATNKTPTLNETGKVIADRFYLPNFCRIRIVFAIVLLGQLFSIVLVITKSGYGELFWAELSLISLFVQWVGLASAALLCIGRPWLNRMPATLAGAISYATVLLVTVVATGLATKVLQRQLQWQPMVQNVTIAAIVAAALLRYFQLQHQWKQRLRLESEARLQALQSQIRPHFLFNSMNTIASLTRSRPHLAEQVTEDLADLFRACLADMRIPSTVQEETTTCRQFIRIEQLRFGERLRSEIALGNIPGHAVLPKFTLQPLVENAIYHGIELIPTGGMIRISGQHQGNQVSILIENSIPERAITVPREGNHIALDNVRKRLEAFFSGKAVIETCCADACYQVRLCFPFVSGVP